MVIASKLWTLRIRLGNFRIPLCLSKKCPRLNSEYLTHFCFTSVKVQRSEIKLFGDRYINLGNCALKAHSFWWGRKEERGGLLS